jgi:hypothetical protein
MYKYHYERGGPIIKNIKGQYSRVRSEKTQLIYCQITSVAHVSTYRSIIRPNLNHISLDTLSRSAHFWEPKMFTTV